MANEKLRGPEISLNLIQTLASASSVFKLRLGAGEIGYVEYLSFEYNGQMAGLLYSFSPSGAALSDRSAGTGASWRGNGMTNK